jgi:hypothetical protein
VKVVRTEAALRALTLGLLVDGIGVLSKVLRMLDVLSVGAAAVMRALQVVGFLRICGCRASAVQDGKYLVVPPLSGPASSRRPTGLYVSTYGHTIRSTATTLPMILAPRPGTGA